METTELIAELSKASKTFWIMYFVHLKYNYYVKIAWPMIECVMYGIKQQILMQ